MIKEVGAKSNIEDYTFAIRKPSVVGDIWRLALSHFLIKIKQHELVVLKTDLWNEVVDNVRSFTEVLYAIKPRKMIFVEIDKRLCAIYQDRNNSHIINADISNLPLNQGSIDLIIDISTSDHLSYHDFKKLVKEYYRVLKKGGHIVLFHLNGNYLNIGRQKSIEDKFFPTFPRKEKEISYILNKYNFHICERRFLFCFFDDSFMGKLTLFLLKFIGCSKLLKSISYNLNLKYFSLQIGYLCKKTI